jgi:hypothetical protein
MADEETGEYVRLVREKDRFVIDPITQRVATEWGRASLKIIILSGCID